MRDGFCLLKVLGRIPPTDAIKVFKLEVFKQ